MYEAERIPKNGRAPKEMGGYPFVQVGDAADYIRKALAEKVITMMPTAVHVVGQQDRPTKSGGSMTTVDLITEWTLTDGESGESITIMSFGSGADGGDKYSGKASTSAMKYALLTGFLLSTGEDSEASPGERPAARPPDRPPLERTTHENGLVGKVATSGTQDFELRETPDGWVLPFRLKEGNKAGQIIIAHDALAQALYPFRETLIGQRVTVWGRYTDEETPTGFGYKVLHLERIQTTDFILPAPDAPQEAPSAPLFPEADLSDLPPEWNDAA